MIVSSTQAESGRQPLERHGVTPRPNAPPAAYRKPFRLAVPALLALIAALAADPAAAQTSITLVSNTGQTDGGSGTLRDLDHAQAFTTGGNSAGYTLTGVDIEFNAVASATASYDVSIQTDNSGSPGTSLGDLTGPATLVANAVNAYTTAGIALAANTTYFVLVDSSSTVINRLQNTTSDNEDSGGQSDWSIADGSVYRNRDNTGGWTDFDESRKIAIKGYAKDTLVSNTGQGNAGVINVSSNEFAQAFGTGSHTAGYDLDSIVLSLGFAPTGTGTLTVTVRADASGDPSGTALHTLTTPDPIAENVLNTFNAPAGATLDADITYWVVASYSSDSGGPNLWRMLLSNGIDSGGAAGWTIDSPYKEDDRTDPDGWEEGASDRALKLQVKGTAKGGPTLSTDATLSALALSGVTLAPAFVSSTETYTATVVNSVMQTTVTATPTHSGATVAFKDGADNALTNPVTLAVGAKVIKAVVTAEDTTTTKTYMVTVTREAPTLSTDATLSALALSGVTLDPTFVSSTETYTATVGNAVTETTVTATVTHSGATFAFKDGDNHTLTSPVSLAVGANVIKAEVTAEDTTTTKTYMVTVTREAAAGTCLAPTFTGRAEVWRGTITVGNDAFSRGYEDNRFGDLSDPDNFDYGGNNYTIAGIRESFDTGSVNRLELDLDAFLPDSDQDKLRLHLCGDTFDLTAASKVNATKTYRWSDAVLDWSGATTIEAALSGSPPAIVTDGVEVTSTAATANTYGLGEPIEITVTFDTAVTVDTTGGTPRIRSVLNGGGTPVDRWAEYSRGSGGTALVFTYTVQAGDMDDDGIWLPANFLQLQGGTISAAADTTVAATLTYAQPGTQSEHKVDGGPTLSTDATLSALALSGVTLAPTFASATEDYTATVVNAVTETTVTATPTHSGATVAFKDGDDNALTNPVTLAVGATVIKAVVTAEDTTTMKTYMVTVTREATTTTAPAIITNGVQVTSTPMATGDTYGLGETIAITVTFDTAVTVDTSGGTPRIQFRLGPPRDDKWAEYSRGSGGTALVFTYMVQADDRDADGIWLPENELELQSGTIRVATDTTVDATLTYSQPGPQSGHKVNGSLTTTDATLSALALTGVTLAPTFVSSTETYTATVGNAVMDTTVTATPTHSRATVAFKDDDDNALTNPVTLVEGANVIKAVVTAEDLTAMKTYMVTVTRGATPVPAIVAGGVRVTSTPMAMDGADTYYGRGETIKITVTFDNAVTVDTSGGTPRIAFHLDGFLLRWAEYSSGSGGQALVFTYAVLSGDRDEDGIWLEENLLELQSGTIRATADHTNTVDATLTYADPGLQSGHKVNGSLTTADATLSALTLSDVTLAQTFAPATEDYTATVVHAVTQTRVTASPTQSGATVAFQDGNGNPLTNPVTLAVGATVIKAVVTAPDTTTTKTYTVTVTLAPAIVTNGVRVTSTPRAMPDTYGQGETIAITVTFDNAVTVDGRPRIAFHLDGGLRWAEYSRGSEGTALVFTYTVLSDDMADTGILLKGDQFDLFGGTIRAAADNTVDATRTYAEPGLQTGHKVDGSLTTTDDDDATLSSLALKDGHDIAITLSPGFAPATPHYTALVANRIDRVVLTATTNDSNAMVAITSDDDTRTPGEAKLDLNVGSNTLTVTVTAEDTTTKTYTITVTRAANTPGVTVSTTALTVTEADMTGDTYTMVLNTQPTANVTVTVAGHVGTDVTPTPASLTFTTSNWTTAQAVTVTAGDDANRANETVSLTHGATSADANYHDITISSVTVTVDDNDARVLVSNLEQSTAGHGDLRAFDQAQAFTTGSNSAGYTLTSIEIEMCWDATPDASFTVSIHSDNSGAPGASLGTLTHPSPLVDNAVNAFTHTGIDLDATTTYFVVLDATGASGGSIRNAGSPAEDSTSAAGWSIGDSSLYRNRTSSGGWTTSRESKKIRINGTVNAGATIDGGGGGGGGGSSGPSQTVPGAPTNLMAVATDGQVTLTWDAPEDDGGTPITDYEYQINGTGNWISTGSTATTYTVTGLDNDTEYTFQVRAVNRIGRSQAPDPAEAAPRAVVDLYFAHFANGADITSGIVLVNVAPYPIQPTLYFSDTGGNPIAADSVVDITGNLMVTEDGSLSVSTAMAPLGELTIRTHGRGDLVSGSVKVVADGPIGGVLRFAIPGLGVAGVGASPPVRDVLFPARRQAGGITTAAALHNLEAEAMGVSCHLMSGGVALEAVEIPLEANGQTAWFIEDVFTTTDTSDFAGAVRCTAPGAGRFTAIAVEIDAAASIFTTVPVVEVNRGRAEAATLDFTHFANGAWITDLVFVNLETRQSGPALTPFHTAIPPTRPAIYFYDTAGNPIAADSLVDITGDLEIAEDGALTVRTEMAPLGVLTISTHGRGELLMGSVRVISEGPIGGMLRFDHPALGVAGVGASTPVGDAIVPVRRQEGGITTGVALHNLESSPGLVRCELRQAGVLLDAVSIPLEANGQTAWFIDQTFPGTDTSDFSGSVRCSATGEGLFTAVALEMDPGNRIFTTLPVVPVVEAP